MDNFFGKKTLLKNNLLSKNMKIKKRKSTKNFLQLPEKLIVSLYLLRNSRENCFKKYFFFQRHITVKTLHIF